jgi:hypothetical protein
MLARRRARLKRRARLAARWESISVTAANPHEELISRRDAEARRREEEGQHREKKP